MVDKMIMYEEDLGQRSGQSLPRARAENILSCDCENHLTLKPLGTFSFEDSMIIDMSVGCFFLLLISGHTLEILTG